MPFVLDASIAACWAFDDTHRVAMSALKRVRTDEVRVPSLWWSEVRNTLIVSERRGRLTESDTAMFLRGLASRLIGRRGGDVLALAYNRGITVYDAAYLELAPHENWHIDSVGVRLPRQVRRSDGEAGESPR
jgi:predicted nucleic acid-binding protein